MLRAPNSRKTAVLRSPSLPCVYIERNTFMVEGGKQRKDDREEGKKNQNRRREGTSNKPDKKEVMWGWTKQGRFTKQVNAPRAARSVESGSETRQSDQVCERSRKARARRKGAAAQAIYTLRPCKVEQNTSAQHTQAHTHECYITQNKPDTKLNNGCTSAKNSLLPSPCDTP